jgi:hypothetical protein
MTLLRSGNTRCTLATLIREPSARNHLLAQKNEELTRKDAEIAVKDEKLSIHEQ